MGSNNDVASVSGEDIFLQLPSHIKLHVMAKLAADLPALQSFCFASRSFAQLFRDPLLWQLLIKERWGAATLPCRGDTLASLRDRFAMRVDASLLQMDQCDSQEVTVTFNNVAKGSYQVLIHKTVLDFTGIPFSTFTTSITGTGLKDHVDGVYQEALYSQQSSISSAAFMVDSPCNVIFSCSCMPDGLDFVQLKKLQQGQQVAVSPQWQEVPGYSEVHSDYPSADTAVGCEESGDPLWLGLRLGRNMRPQVGKIGPHLQRQFHYAENHNSREQRNSQSEYFDSPTLSGVMHPGILVNASDFEWVTTCLKDVHVLLNTAVPLGVCTEAMRISTGRGSRDTHAHVLYGARISFCGWDRTKRGICAMVMSGRQISLLPGKLAVYKNGSAAAVFTWGGDTTSRSGLDDQQPFQLLCFKHL